MPKFVCTKCNWEGTEEELIQAPICPNCAVGHSPLWRLMKKGGDLECPNCSWRNKMELVPKEFECGNCGSEYLKRIN